MKKKSIRIDEYKKEFEQLFTQLTYSRGREATDVFSDLLELIICCFARGSMEKRYFEIIGKYKKDEIDLFPNLLAYVILQSMDMETHGYNDCLGHFYEQFIKSSWKASATGQFFTPDNICTLMAKLTIGSDQANKRLKINDCACGSGRNLLAANAQAPGNYFFGEDIDAMCVYLTTVNFILHKMEGQVCCLDSIMPDRFFFGYEVALIPSEVNGEIQSIPIVRKISADESFTYTQWKVQREEYEANLQLTASTELSPEPKQPNPEHPKNGGNKLNKANSGAKTPAPKPQLTLF